MRSNWRRTAISRRRSPHSDVQTERADAQTPRPSAFLFATACEGDLSAGAARCSVASLCHTGASNSILRIRLSPAMRSLTFSTVVRWISCARTSESSRDRI